MSSLNVTRMPDELYTAITVFSALAGVVAENVTAPAGTVTRYQSVSLVVMDCVPAASPLAFSPTTSIDMGMGTDAGGVLPHDGARRSSSSSTARRAGGTAGWRARGMGDGLRAGGPSASECTVGRGGRKCTRFAKNFIRFARQSRFAAGAMGRLRYGSQSRGVGVNRTRPPRRNSRRLPVTGRRHGLESWAFR